MSNNTIRSGRQTNLPFKVHYLLFFLLVEADSGGAKRNFYFTFQSTLSGTCLLNL